MKRPLKNAWLNSNKGKGIITETSSAGKVILRGILKNKHVLHRPGVVPIKTKNSE